MKSSIIAAAACLSVLASAAASASAQTTANEVFVGGTVIMRVQVASGPYTTTERASAIQSRVNLLLGSGPIAPADITVESFGNEAVVRVKGELLFTADTMTARYNSSTPLDLANTWAGHMREVLPSLTAPK